ncbi:hypothetical protein GCM10028784_16900 [Myceligenerans cantabricum]
MGLSGEILLAHYDQPLETMPFLADKVEQDPVASIDPCWANEHGWQLVEVGPAIVGEDLFGDLAELIRITGAPVAIATVNDSDWTWITGQAPGSEPWHAATHPDTLIAHMNDDVILREHLVGAQDPTSFGAELKARIPQTARDILHWARAAGFTSGRQDTIENLLRAKEVFAESLWHDILEELGFPCAPFTEYRPPLDRTPVQARRTVAAQI